MKKNISTLLSFILILSLGLIGCQSLNGKNAKQLTASGTISAVQVEIAPQIGGMVVKVDAEEGMRVKKGDELFRLDDALLNAQRDQADAAVKLAKETLDSAKIQYDLAVMNARLQDQRQRTSSWKASQPSQFDLPVWYFNKEEKISSAKAEIDAANEDLDKEKENLKKLLTSSSSQDFLNAEKLVADAQAAFLIADQVLSQAKNANEKEDLQNYAQDLYDAAESKLKTAQSNYDRLLTTQAAKDVLEARARLQVAQERYDRALDYHQGLMSGEQSLAVKAAESGVKQAEAALLQAQKALAAIDIQLEKTIVTAPMDGMILSRNLEVGETLSPGGVVLTIGQLQEVNLTVYIPETEYGKVKIGEQVSITVDSHPGKSYVGTVTYISNQAEFTPKNVQTIEGRRTTVFAVKISVPNPDFELKPGMPADVTFGAK